MVPDATGKLNIWAAKMNAAANPASGTWRSSSSSAARRREMPTTARLKIAVANATPGVRNPSGACMAKSIGPRLITTQSQ